MKPEPVPKLPDTHLIVFFDGFCHLCNGAVHFLLDRDGHDRLRFATLQDPRWQEDLEASGVRDLDSIIVYDRGNWLTFSDAVLRISEELPGFWKHLSRLGMIRQDLRDSGYRFIAKNRHRLFGKRNTCRMPTPEERAKFL